MKRIWVLFYTRTIKVLSFDWLKRICKTEINSNTFIKSHCNLYYDYWKFVKKKSPCLECSNFLHWISLNKPLLRINIYWNCWIAFWVYIYNWHFHKTLLHARRNVLIRSVLQFTDSLIQSFHTLQPSFFLENNSSHCQLFVLSVVAFLTEFIYLLVYRVLLYHLKIIIKYRLFTTGFKKKFIKEDGWSTKYPSDLYVLNRIIWL